MTQIPSPTALVPEAPAEPPAVAHQALVPFLGDQLLAAQTQEGIIYISVNGMCQALGLDPSSQLHRLRRHTILQRGLQTLPLTTAGGSQLTNCLRVDLLALWLAGSETRRMQPAIREKIEAYQEALAPVAMQVFLRFVHQSATTLATVPEIAPLLTQINDLQGVTQLLQEHLSLLLAQQDLTAAIPSRLDRVVNLLEQVLQQQEQITTHQGATDSRLTQLRREQPLTPAHKRHVQTAVDEIVRTSRHLATALNHAQIYGRLKQQFNVGSYTELPDTAFAAVLTTLRGMRQQVGGDSEPDQPSLF